MAACMVGTVVFFSLAARLLMIPCFQGGVSLPIMGLLQLCFANIIRLDDHFCLEITLKAVHFLWSPKSMPSAWFVKVKAVFESTASCTERMCY